MSTFILILLPSWSKHVLVKLFQQIYTSYCIKLIILWWLPRYLNHFKLLGLMLGELINWPIDWCINFSSISATLWHLLELIDLLVFNANFISAILWHLLELIDLLVFNANFNSISAISWHLLELIDWFISV